MGFKRRPFPPKRDSKKPRWNGNKKKPEAEKKEKATSFYEKKQNYKPKIQLREDQAGILEYVNDGPGFTGIFKSRFSDFHVNEIDLDGKVLHLTCLDVPKPKEDKLEETDLQELRKQLEGVVSESMWSKFNALTELKPNEPGEPCEFNVTNVDKETRTKIHQIIKQIYNKKLVSTTINEGDERIIRVMKKKGPQGEETRRDWSYPGQYVHFLVHKENMDTAEVVAGLASRVNVKPSLFSYCGTKDKRGKTTQKLCIRKRLPSALVNGARKMNGVHVGNFTFADNALRLGDLKGNKFRIALRHVNGNKEDIETRLKSLQENGFINYYGLQRFGNCASIPTYEIGIALLKSDYKLACELILKPRENDLEFLRKIRETWWKNRDSKEAVAMFYNSRFVEQQLLSGLAKHGENDYATSIRCIPRNTLLLYLHAFQSLIFNLVASKRIHKYGLKLIPGDLVFKNENANNGMVEDDIVSEEKENDEEPANKKSKMDDDKDSISGDENDAEPSPSFIDKVKALTEEEIESKKYTIFDIVLPLPGFDIAYPANETGKWYEEYLEEHGLSSDKMRHNIKTFAMPGAYRKMLIKPIDMSWEFKTYKSNEETLIASDWENLKANATPSASPAAAKTPETAGTSKTTKSSTAPQDGSETAKNPKTSTTSETGEANENTALLLTFSLPSSAYATMLLRELLKTDTSASNQAQLEMKQIKKLLDATGKESDTAAPKDIDAPPQKQPETV